MAIEKRRKFTNHFNITKVIEYNYTFNRIENLHSKSFQAKKHKIKLIILSFRSIGKILKVNKSKKFRLNRLWSFFLHFSMDQILNIRMNNISMEQILGIHTYD